MTHLRVNGHQLYYEDYGKAESPAIVLLHHGLGSTYSWMEQIDSLTVAGFRVIAYDRWGYGHSDPRQSLSLPCFDEDLADLAALFAFLELRRAILVGHSDGGTIALYFAAKNPESTDALVTIAAHIYIEEKMVPSIQVVQKSYLEGLRFKEGLRRLHGEKVEQVFTNWFNGWAKPENFDWDMRPLLKEIRCPSLIVQGMDDEHATPRHAEDIAVSIAGSELWLVPGARHMLPQENAALFNSRLVEFLSGNGRQLTDS